MRRVLLAGLILLVWLSTGCTSSDRDYVRNHIVHSAPQQPLPHLLSTTADAR